MQWRCMRKYNKDFFILNFGFRWRWAANFKPRPLFSRGETLGNHQIGGLTGPRTGLDAVEERKISFRAGSWTRTRVSLYWLVYIGFAAICNTSKIVRITYKMNITINRTVSWDMTPCCPIKLLFGRMYSPYLQGRIVNQGSNQHEASACILLIAWITFRPWR